MLSSPLKLQVVDFDPDVDDLPPALHRKGGPVHPNDQRAEEDRGKV